MIAASRNGDAMRARRWLGLTAVVCLALACGPEYSPDGLYAPPGFPYNGGTTVAIDILSESLRYEFDVTNQRTTATADITFQMGSSGYPMFLMHPRALEVSLDQSPIALSALSTATPEGSDASLSVLSVPTAPGSHTLHFGFELPPGTVSYTNGGASFSFLMNDLEGYFLDKYAPANFEFDQFSLHVELEVVGATHEEQLFTNGSLQQVDSSSWNVDFPSYFTSSSPFLELTAENVKALDFSYQGKSSSFTCTIIMEAADMAGASRAQDALTQALDAMESDFGPYGHDRFLLRVLRDPMGILGGMEYCGAAWTSLRPSFIGHEVSHSWFGRGIMPANGNAGWIDEAIATWHDQSYPSTRVECGSGPVNLAAHSPYSRTTPLQSYQDGAYLMAMLNSRLWGKGGLKPLLRKWYERDNHHVVNTEDFERFLEDETGIDLSALFGRFAFGRRTSCE